MNSENILPVILFNCSTNNVGGGMKNSALFIQESLKDNSIKWNYAVSEEIANFLTKFSIN